MRSFFALALALVACGGSSLQPVFTPDAVVVNPGGCSSLSLKSYRGSLTPEPATQVEATAADANVVRAVVEGHLVHLLAVGPGATPLQIRFIDPATNQEARRTLAVRVEAPPPSKGPYPLYDGTKARCEELRARLATPQ